MSSRAINGLTFLQRWYLAQCDGDWEHSYGIRIDTLDNPGWHLTVDLVGTEMEGRSFEAVSIERAEDDWIQCRVKDASFEGAGGPLNLDEILDVFAGWARDQAQ